MLAILASAIAIIAASFIAGRAFLFALGRTRPTWLSGAIGFAVLVIACPILIHLPGRATTATIVVVLSLLLSLAWMRRRFFAVKAGDQAVGEVGPGERGGTAGPGTQSGSSSTGAASAAATSAKAPPYAHQTALATVLITLVLACLPFAFNGSTGVLGEGIYTNDQAAQLYWTDWLQHGVGPEPSAVKFGYPTGPQSFTAVAADATGASLEHAFNGLLVAIAVLGALAALSALGELAPRRRVAGAVLCGLPYMGASFLAQSAFKETAMGLLVLALAVVLSEFSRPDIPRRAGVGAVLVLAAASVFTFSVPGLLWFALAIPLWLVMELIRGDGEVRGLVGSVWEALKRHRGLVAIGLVVIAVVALLGAGAASHFFHKISKVQNSPGRLGSPVFGGEVLGVWPEGDFRIVRGAVSGALPAAAFGFLAVALGALIALRRRRNAAVAVVAAGAVIYVGARLDASIYVQAKALAVIAPTVAFVAVASLLAPNPDAAAAPATGCRRPPWLQLFGALFAAFALCSTLLALRAAPVGFDNRARDLEAIGERIQGKAVVFLGLDRFSAYWLRGTLVKAPGGYVPPAVKARKDKSWFQGRPVDFDTMSPERLDDFRYAVTTTAAFQSSPPPNMSVVDRQGDYELWKRKGKTPEQRVLNEGGAPGLTVDCNAPAGSDLSVQDGRATVLADPVVGQPESWGEAPFSAPGSASQTLELTPGRWDLSLQYASQAKLIVSGPGFSAGLPPSLDGVYFSHAGQGAFWAAGALHVRHAGPVKITVTAERPGALSRLAGVTRRVWLGAVAASPRMANSTVPLDRSCGRYVDHFTLSGPAR